MKLIAEKTARHLGGTTAELLDSFYGFVAFLGETASAVMESVRHPRRIRWRETLFYMNSCGVEGLPITALICFLMGVILGYQAAVQMHRFGADNFLPMLVGCAILRELGPLMVAVVATGRSGSAFAAEIATMKISEELDAMTTMGIRPARFLVVPKLLAMLCMIPLLTVFGDVFGCIGGYFVGSAELGLTAENYIRLTRETVNIKYFYEGILKSMVFAALITLIGCWRGFKTGNDAIAVGNSTTSAVVLSILLVIISDSVMAKLFMILYDMGGY